MRLPPSVRICILPPPAVANTAVIIADGNQRAGAGLQLGRHGVIRVGRWGAEQADIGTVAICVLSTSNLRLRSDAWAESLYREVVELCVAIERDGLLVKDGIQLGLAGDISCLLSRGGVWRAVGEALLAAVRRAGNLQHPRVCLLLAVAYPDALIGHLGAQIVIRTGVEQNGLARLSGLEPNGAIIATTPTLFPLLGTDELDRLWNGARQHVSRCLRPGLPLNVVQQMCTALAKRQFNAPVQITIQADGCPDSIADLARRLGGRQLHPVEAVLRWSVPATGNDVLLLSASSPLGNAEPFHALIAAGQTTSSLILPPGLFLGEAAVHAADFNTESIIEAIGTAVHFHQSVPQLRGAERNVEDTDWRGEWPTAILQNMGWVEKNPHAALEDLARRAFPGHIDEARWPAVEIELACARFLYLVLHDEVQKRLIASDNERRRAALNYIYTAFISAYRMPFADDQGGTDWECHAARFAIAMLTVAAGDELIFDAWLPGESAQAHLARIQRAEQHLSVRLNGVDPPENHSDDVTVEGVATNWSQIFHRGVEAGHTLLVDGLHRALLATNRANVLEWLPGPRVNADTLAQCMTSLLRTPPQPLPASVVEHLERLTAFVNNDDDSNILRQLHVWLWLVERAPTLAAGIAFRVLALEEPELAITPEMARRLDDVATIADLFFRLANDLAGFHCSPTGDRDGKENAWSILVPNALAPSAYADALIGAVGTCREVLRWLDEAFGDAIGALAEVWPNMASLVARSSEVGRQVYNRAHFSRLDTNDILQLLHEVEMRYPYAQKTARLMPKKTH